jgi:hypothetical protein
MMLEDLDASSGEAPARLEIEKQYLATRAPRAIFARSMN